MKKNKFKFFSRLFAIFISFFLVSQDAISKVRLPIFGLNVNEQPECPDRLEARELTQIQQSYSPSLKRCYLSISHRNNYQTLIYRDYLISNEGHLMAFLSFGPGPDQTSTGAKEFFFFPRKIKSQSFYWDDYDSKLIIKASTPFDFIFRTETSEIEEISQAQVFIDPKISKENDGGIKILPRSGLVLEFPFQLGRAPTSIPSLKGKFIDANSNTCSLRVSDLFKRLTSDGDVEFKFDDVQLTRYLKTKCPQLRFSL